MLNTKWCSNQNQSITHNFSIKDQVKYISPPTLWVFSILAVTHHAQRTRNQFVHKTQSINIKIEINSKNRCNPTLPFWSVWWYEKRTPFPVSLSRRSEKLNQSKKERQWSWLSSAIITQTRVWSKIASLMKIGRSGEWIEGESQREHPVPRAYSEI